MGEDIFYFTHVKIMVSGICLLCSFNTIKGHSYSSATPSVTYSPGQFQPILTLQDSTFRFAKHCASCSGPRLDYRLIYSMLQLKNLQKSSVLTTIAFLRKNLIPFSLQSKQNGELELKVYKQNFRYFSQNENFQLNNSSSLHSA